MFSTKDLGQEVKVVELSGIRTRGYVVAAGKDDVEIHIDETNTTVTIPYKKISTVVRVGDFS
jgi:hypothetical protein